MREWLTAQQRADEWTELHADDGAGYDEREEIDLAALEPLIAVPQSPGDVVAVADVAGTRAVQVCVGSSVNSSYDDLATVAAVLADRSVHPDVAVTVTPGSRQILDTIGRSGVYRQLVDGRCPHAGAGLRAVHRHRAGPDRRARRRYGRSTATSPAAAAPLRTGSTSARHRQRRPPRSPG